VNIEIGNKKTPISFKLDTGAQVNVIPSYVFHQLGCNDLESTSQRLFGYGGKSLNVEGKCILACSYKGTQRHHLFHEVFTQVPPILGLSSCLSVNLIQLILSVEKKENIDTLSQNPGDILTEYKDVFEGLGSFMERTKSSSNLTSNLLFTLLTNRNSSSKQAGKRIKENGSPASHSKGYGAHRLGQLNCNTGKVTHRCLASVFRSKRFELCC